MGRFYIFAFTISIFFGCHEDQANIEKESSLAIADTIQQEQSDSGETKTDEAKSTLLSTRINYKLSYSARQGERLYHQYCAVCHGKSGGGDGFNAWNLQPRPRDLTDSAYMNVLSDERIAEAIREGGAGVQKSELMPAWGNTFTKTEINQLVSFIRTLSK